MRYLVSAMLLIVGILHLLPVSGVLGAGHLTALYGLPFSEPNLEILMRHRAVLFGLLGCFLIFAAFKPAFRTLALIAGATSVLSFLALAASVGGYNALVARVFAADLVALSCLIVAAVGIALAASRVKAGSTYSGVALVVTQKPRDGTR